jgi:transposase
MEFLDDEERTHLKLKHKQERDGRIRDRIKAVLLHDSGWSPQKIAEALLISDEAVRNHIEEYKTIKKLRSENGGSQEKLSEKQSRQLEVHLQEHTYLYVKNIVAYVEIDFGVKYTQTPSKLGISALPKPRDSTIVNRSILLILTCLRSLNRESFGFAENQVLKVFGYIPFMA